MTLTDFSTPRAAPVLVVGVGASAGGFEAFKDLLANVPDDSGMAFLLVQHLNRTRPSLLTERLATCTGMAVADAEHGTELRADTVYVIRPGTILEIRGGSIEVTAAPEARRMHLPVDHLFRSLARELGPRAVGVVLSGAASDGFAGLRDIKAAGGLTIAQNPATSSQTGMPQSAIDTGSVDLVLAPGEIPCALERFASIPTTARLEPVAPQHINGQPSGSPLTLSDDQVGRLASLLGSQSDFNPLVYKLGTVTRRVFRRMTLAGLSSPDAYLERLRTDETEQRTLAGDLLISVTDFFRDPDAFKTLRTLIIDPLVAKSSAGGTLRAWIAGCATGEEAYSIAMELLESINAHQAQLSVQVFATDLDRSALEVGRAGIYPPSIRERISPNRLQKYFAPLNGMGYQVQAVLREAVSFAVHDLTRDPPFARMDVVSCRNVLIYLRPAAQERVLNVLHFALRPKGHLLLGTSESAGAGRELFSTISKAWRIYQKVGSSHPLSLSRGTALRLRGEQGQTRTAPNGPEQRLPRRGNGGDLARSLVMQARVPPTIVVSKAGVVIFTHGELRPYLRFPEGANPQLDLSAVIMPALATRTRAALFKCRRDRAQVVALSSPDSAGGQIIRITATPAFELEPDAVMLTFEEAADRTANGAPTSAGEPADDADLEALERELLATREDLRSTLEELETTSQELRSSNDEAVSMNEELQSANEELEATSEELRSLNEELTTVNSELRDKVDQLEQAHDDLNNFFDSTKIAIVFFDDRLCINRFTPAAAELLRIDQADLGRFVGDMARDLLQHELESEARTVLQHLVPQSRELRTKDGRWITRQVLPYRTESRRIEGVVVTLVDVTTLKLATERLATRERQQAVIARLGLRALKEPDLLSFMDQAVREVQQTLGTDCCKILELEPGGGELLLRAGVGWREGLVGSGNVSAGTDSQAGYTLSAGETVFVDDLATEKRFSGPALLTEHGIVSGLSCVISDDESDYGVLGAHTRQQRSFGREDADFLQAVAGVIGSAITRRQTRIRIAVERGVARALAESSGVEDAVTRVFECLGSEVQTSVGELWWPAPDQRTLSRHMSWRKSAAEHGANAENSGPNQATRGEGLVGRVFEQGAAGWASALRDPAEILRVDPHGALGLVTALAVPLSARGVVLGVMTVFSTDRLIAHHRFLSSLETRGRSIGEFIVRTEAEDDARHLAAITQSSHDAILSYDFDGRIREWLGGAEALYGYTAEEMIGESVERLLPEDRRDELHATVARIRRGEVIEPADTVRIRRDDTRIEVSVRYSPIRDQWGTIVALSSTARDMTRQRDTESRLREADRQKDEFLAMLGHELRNPLAAVRGAADVLKLSGLSDPRVQRTQAILERQTKHMAKLLDGLLDVSRIIRGRITIEKAPVDLVAVCREVLADVMERVTTRKIVFRPHLPSYPIWIEGDRVRLVQIVDNLLSNAVKYSNDGGLVRLELERRDGLARLEVRDAGVGIEPELLPHIFDVFRQAEQSLDRSHGGLGLGLALARSLVELHGGTIEARSEGAGCGAEFVVRLPRGTEPAAHGDSRAFKDGSGFSILLVEDNADAAEMLRQVLELSGHRVRVAAHGEQGLELARQQAPDVVLCDLGLPGITGYEVAERLRADAQTHDIPLVALSGYGRPEDKARCAAAGFDAHLTKPVDASTVERLVAKLGAAARASSG